MVPVYDYNDPIHRQALEQFGQCINCGLILCNEENKYATTYVNDMFPQYLGYSHDEFLETFPHFIDCIHPEDRDYVHTTIHTALEKAEVYDLIFRVVHRDGHTVWIRENGKRAVGPMGELLLFCLLVDISADMATRQEMELQSTTDALTGVLNRAAFIDRIGRLFHETPRKDRRHAFIMLDLDHFKLLNDTFGHGFGDKVLQDVSQSLKTIVRTGDILGRLGGDEFMLCLKDIPQDDSFNKRMAQICTLLHKPLPVDVTLSASVGVAFYPADGNTFETLYRCADIALYAAKKAGRNQFMFYHPDMDEGEFVPNNTPIDER